MYLRLAQALDVQIEVASKQENVRPSDLVPTTHSATSVPIVSVPIVKTTHSVRHLHARRVALLLKIAELVRVHLTMVVQELLIFVRLARQDVSTVMLEDKPTMEIV